MFKDELRRRKIESNLRSSDVAEEIGITRGGYSHYENGDAYPDRQKLERICKLLNWDFTEAWRMILDEKYGGAEADDKVDNLFQLIERLPLNKRDKVVDAWTQILEVMV